MTCPTVIRVTTGTGPPGIGLPAGTGDAGKFVRKAGATPYAYELVTPDQVGLPQGLSTTSSPTFVGLTLSGRAGNAGSLALFGAGGAIGALPLGSGLSIVDGALTATGGAGSNLGTAASRNVPATGDASAAEVVLGADSRLSNSRAPQFATTTTYSASGAIAPTDRVAVINAASAVTMTLASGSSNGQSLLVKRIGAGAVTITASFDGMSGSIIADSTTIKESVLLAWSTDLSTGLSTWLIL